MSKVVDVITGQEINKYEAFDVVIGIDEYGDLTFGKSRCIEKCPACYFGSRDRLFRIAIDKFRDEVLFSNKRGYYKLKREVPKEKQLHEVLARGNGNFPYNRIGDGMEIGRRYEAIESFGKFENRQTLLEDYKNPLSDYLDYTFGLEFETSAGYVPEDLCYRDGLIPLRDGSISGVEYSTVVLKGEKGLAMLRQQVGTLKKYTEFNKECSLHIHFGGYPLEKDKVFSLYAVCQAIQGNIQKIVPELTFNTSRYKSSGKDYCKKLPYWSNFESMYRAFVGRNYMGSLTQAHPNDITRERKWQIPTRYYYVNFINMLCYNVNKTVEWRFLRPTYNYRKITLWMYIFNAIMKYSDKHSEEIVEKMNDGKRLVLSLGKIVKDTYPQELAKELIEDMHKLQVIVERQTEEGDRIGAQYWMEDEAFPE